MPPRAIVSILALLIHAWDNQALAQEPAGSADPSGTDRSTTDAEVVIDSADSAKAGTSAMQVGGSTASGTSTSAAAKPTHTVVETAPSAPAPVPIAVPPASRTAAAAPAGAKTIPPAVDLSGYAQIQYESHKDSEDQLRQGGTPYNQDRFLVRRIRLEASRRYDFAGYLLELDANTTSGPAIGIHRAEASLYYDSRGQDQPLVEFTAGLLKLPFGYETPESSRKRWFMERSAASRAFFPNEVDVGIRLHGAWRFLRYGVALTNGEPKGTRATSFQLQDPNRAKDVTVRLGAEVPTSDRIRLSGGVTYLSGKGFHAGDSATKSSVTWNDSNEDGKISSDELKGVPGKTAEPSENFRRWGLGADLQVRLRTQFGWSCLFGEVVAAVNLDRGLYVADPTLTRIDARELGWHVGFTQEVTRYAVVGFRFDFYDPNSDLLDDRGGKSIPSKQAISTYSPLLGLSLPDRARLVFQYDVVRDRLARNTSGVPIDLANDMWTIRLQVNL